MCQFVKLTKLRRADYAGAEPGRWDDYRMGRGDNKTSLPVDYVMVGFLVHPPTIGGTCKLLRIERNGIVALGVFESTVIKEVSNAGFVTQNSVYAVEPVDLAKYLDRRR